MDDAPLPPTPAQISRAQNVCMFVGAAACGSSAVIVYLVMFVGAGGRTAPTLDETPFFVLFGIAALCHVAISLVFGAWLGGLVSFLWRSPPGGKLFLFLTSGVLGMMLA